MIFRNLAWHTGLYVSYQRRATIHDIVSYATSGDWGTRWSQVKLRLPLLTEHPETYLQTRYGYARSGAQSVIYVERINQFYNLLLWASETPQLASNWAALNKAI